MKTLSSSPVIEAYEKQVLDVKKRFLEKILEFLMRGSPVFEMTDKNQGTRGLNFFEQTIKDIKTFLLDETEIDKNLKISEEDGIWKISLNDIPFNRETIQVLISGLSDEKKNIFSATKTFEQWKAENLKIQTKPDEEIAPAILVTMKELEERLQNTLKT